MELIIFWNVEYGFENNNNEVAADLYNAIGRKVSKFTTSTTS